MAEKVKVLETEFSTHDVLRLRFEKPKDYTFTPGQAADISIEKPGWEETKSCFTFVSLPQADYLEFEIKTYPDRKRVTNELRTIKVGDTLNLFDPFGDIRYKGEGVFIAGGAGITPFLAILRTLENQQSVGNNKLIFANKTVEDIIEKDYFSHLLGENFINVLSADASKEASPYEKGFINAEIIKKYRTNPEGYIYLCGPPPMMDAVEGALDSLGISREKLIRESF